MVCCLIVAKSCYSNRSIRRICWHLDGLYFPDIQRGGRGQSLMRGLRDNKSLSFQLYHIGPTLGVFWAWPFVHESGKGTLWRGVESREGADPGRLGRRLEGQLKHGGPCRPFVLHHLCAVVLGVEPKERYLYCASRELGCGRQSCLRNKGLTYNDRAIIAWQINYWNIWLYEYWVKFFK